MIFLTANVLLPIAMYRLIEYPMIRLGNRLTTTPPPAAGLARERDPAVRAVPEQLSQT
jgi:hypothetical protein